MFAPSYAKPTALRFRSGWLFLAILVSSACSSRPDGVEVIELASAYLDLHPSAPVRHLVLDVDAMSEEASVVVATALLGAGIAPRDPVDGVELRASTHDFDAMTSFSGSADSEMLLDYSELISESPFSLQLDVEVALVGNVAGRIEVFTVISLISERREGEPTELTASLREGPARAD